MNTQELVEVAEAQLLKPGQWILLGAREVRVNSVSKKFRQDGKNFVTLTIGDIVDDKGWTMHWNVRAEAWIKVVFG